MKLPESVIKRFASLTKSDDKKTTSSGIFYGTIKSVGSNPTVQLDGSTVTTPVILGAAAKEGDRVTVSIADHKATVSSNITNPASAYGAKDLFDNGKASDIFANAIFAKDISATGTITGAKLVGASISSDGSDGGINISNYLFRSYSKGSIVYSTTINCGQISGEYSRDVGGGSTEDHNYSLYPMALTFSSTDAQVLIGSEDGYGHFYNYTGHGIYYGTTKMLGFGEDVNGLYMFSDPTYARPYHSSTANVVITKYGVFGSRTVPQRDGNTI